MSDCCSYLFSCISSQRESDAYRSYSKTEAYGATTQRDIPERSATPRESKWREHSHSYSTPPAPQIEGSQRGHDAALPRQLSSEFQSSVAHSAEAQRCNSLLRKNYGCANLLILASGEASEIPTHSRADSDQESLSPNSPSAGNEFLALHSRRHPAYERERMALLARRLEQAVADHFQQEPSYSGEPEDDTLFFQMSPVIQGKAQRSGEISPLTLTPGCYHLVKSQHEMSLSGTVI